MTWFDFFWTPESIAHIAEHGITPEEVEYVIQYPESTDLSRTTGSKLAEGEAANGKYIIVIYDMIDEVTVIPVTAYEPN
ncbi:MAG: DUF4258 domain-containing protein [Planctomycetaceae bacterium]|nr:DUF4258 domain-containing protein [Planctomycetaceae bacterium]